jgi:hypothetical protein
MNEIAVGGSSQQENRINTFHDNFMGAMRKNNDSQNGLTL